MLIENRRTGESEEIPVCVNAKFHAYWEKAAKEVGLEMIQALGGLWITADYRDRFLSELMRLKTWAAAQAATDDYLPEMARRIDAIVEAIISHPLDRYEISFG
jgi:hypothetical protein